MYNDATAVRIVRKSTCGLVRSFMLVRPAKLDDVDRLVEMGARFHQESVYSFLPFDRDKVCSLVVDLIQNPEDNYALVAEENGTVVGMMGGFITDYFFCHEKMA